MVKVVFLGGGGGRDNSTTKLLLCLVSISSCAGLESLRFLKTTCTGSKPKKFAEILFTNGFTV